MKAWVLNSLGGLGALQLGELPDPVPGNGEVVLDVRLAALNPADRYLSEGAYPARPPFPHVLGRDAVGIVSAVGDEVAAPRKGEKMLLLRSEIGVSRPGTFAQRVAIPVEPLVTVPAGWTDEQAAGAPLVNLTAYQAITQWDDLPPGGGAVLLVSGASGGVGVATIQLGTAMGHTVIGLSRGDAKREALRGLGAAAVFDPNEPSWPNQLKEFLGEGRRVDLAIDNIGGPLLPRVIDTLGHRGRVSLVGRLAGPVPSFNTASLFFRRIAMRGVAVGTYTPPESRAAWGEVVRLLDQTGAKPVVDSIFPFERLIPAFERLAQGPMGKVLLKVKDEG